MKTRGQNSCCIRRPADKSGLRHPVRNQVGVERYLSGINRLKDSLQGDQNCVKSNSGPSETSKSSNQTDIKRKKNRLANNTNKPRKPTTP